MADIRELSVRYQEIGRALIQREGALAALRASTARIAFLASSAEKRHAGKVVYGQCEKVPEKNKWGLPYDFTVTVFEPNVAGFSEAQLETLIFHELLHIGIGHNKDGDEKYFVVPHDYGEFREISDRFGLDWHLAARAEG